MKLAKDYFLGPFGDWNMFTKRHPSREQEPVATNRTLTKLCCDILASCE